MKSAIRHLLRAALVVILFVIFITDGMDADARKRDDDTANPFTHGKVQMTLETGVTTQAEVLEAFGAPNITTIDGQGREVWTYQKHATASEERRRGIEGSILIVRASSETVGFDQSSRTMTLIIKFGPDKKIADFKSMSTSF